MNGMMTFLRHRAPIILFILIILGIVFFGGYRYGVKQAPEIYKVNALDNKEEGKPSVVDFSAFWKTWNLLNEKYVPTRVATSTGTTTAESIGDQEKMWGAIQGLAASLRDPYTVFFPPEENKIFASEISGMFEGVGMEIGIKDNILTVVAPLKDTPAERAGIQAGDKILKIDSVFTDGMSTDSAIRKIRGKQGTRVKLLLLRKNADAPFEVSIVRDVIKIPVINTEVRRSDGSVSPDKSVGLREDGIFVIKLYSFTDQSPSLFQGAVREFFISGSTRLLLDLRGNPGGYLEAAVRIASFFLEIGKPVVKEEYAKDDIRVYRSYGYDVFNKNLKMVVLVDEGSASASEILAGALREYNIATLVGTKTFGKGSVQELVSVTPDTSLKVTVARWLTPSGRNISEEGLTPDVVVERTQEDLTKERDPQMDKAIELLLK